MALCFIKVNFKISKRIRGNRDKLVASAMSDGVGIASPNASRILGTNNMANVSRADESTDSQRDLWGLDLKIECVSERQLSATTNSKNTKIKNSVVRASSRLKVRSFMKANRSIGERISGIVVKIIFTSFVKTVSLGSRGVLA